MIYICTFCEVKIENPCLNFDYPNKGDGLMIMDKFVCRECIPKVYDDLFNDWNIKGT